MATEAILPKQMVMADLKGKVDPDWCPGCGDFGVLAAADWCPGCGDFGVLAAVQKALVELQIPKHEVATISGIGCSSNFPGFIDTYGMHTLHGRSLPVASGMKLANHAMTVLVTGGDGDGFGIGAGHFVHTMRRNLDLTYIVMDNQIYGLTTGQTSPTSRIGMKTKSMPFGNVDEPSSTKASPSSTSSAHASPTTTTTPSSGSARASKSSKTTRPTIPPTFRRPLKNRCSGAMRFLSDSSSSAPTYPQRTTQSRS